MWNPRSAPLSVSYRSTLTKSTLAERRPDHLALQVSVLRFPGEREQVLFRVVQEVHQALTWHCLIQEEHTARTVGWFRHDVLANEWLEPGFEFFGSCLALDTADG